MRLLPIYEARLSKAQAIDDARAKRAALRAEKRDAILFSGHGDVKIAVGNIDLNKTTALHYARGNNVFVWVFINAQNNGQNIVHVNPNDFTLATQDGSVTPHDSGTYSLENYFDAVDLRPAQKTQGWLAFLIMRDSRYTLSYQGSGGTAQKAVIP